MSSAYLWVKAAHIIFVISWFAGLFYLPRIFVNLAMVDEAAKEHGAVSNSAERARLLLMAGKLYRFMAPLMLLALIFGAWLWLGMGIGTGPGSGWMHAKLMGVFVLLAYHFYCGQLLHQLQTKPSDKSHVWFRWFNEFPVIILMIIVVLVVVKPF